MSNGRVIHLMDKIASWVLGFVVVAVVLLVVNVQSTNGTIARNARNGYIAGCQHTNQVGHGLLDGTIDRAERALKGTLSSPFTTAEQKTAARVNLHTLYTSRRKQRAVLSDKNCIYPPVPPTTAPSTPKRPTTSAAG